MLELHEIIRSDVTVAAKLQASMAMVTDPDLEALMQTALDTKQQALRQYQDFYMGVEERQ
jgi:hypothetical protein